VGSDCHNDPSRLDVKIGLGYVDNKGKARLSPQIITDYVGQAERLRQIDKKANSSPLRDTQPATRREEIAQRLPWPKRWELARDLGEGGRGNTFQELMRLTQDEVWVVRMAAVRSLGERGPPPQPELTFALAERLFDLANSDPAREVQKAALIALGSFRHSRNISQFLINFLKISQDTELCQAAVEALGLIGDVEVVEALKEELKPSLDKHLALEIVRALGRLGFAQAREVLRQCQQDRKYDIFIRRRAGWELIKLNIKEMPQIKAVSQDKTAESLTEEESRIQERNLVCPSLKKNHPARFRERPVDTKVRYPLKGASYRQKISTLKRHYGFSDKTHLFEPEIGTGKDIVVIATDRATNKRFYLKRIADSYEGALYIVSYLLWLKQNETRLKIAIPSLVPTAKGFYAVKIGPYYYSLETELPLFESVEPADIKDEHFVAVGELAGLMHKLSAESFVPAGFKCEYLLSNVTQDE
jgi:hypothetical protein